MNLVKADLKDFRCQDVLSFQICGAAEANQSIVAKFWSWEIKS